LDANSSKTTIVGIRFVGISYGSKMIQVMKHLGYALGVKYLVRKYLDP
jgi:hypothetical protein